MEWALMFKTQNVSIIHNFQPRDRQRDDEYRWRYGVWERRPTFPFERESAAERIARIKATLNDTNAFFKRANKPVFHSFKQNNWSKRMRNAWVIESGIGEPPNTIQDWLKWLKNNQISSKYANIFSWNGDKLYFEYDRLFKQIHIFNEKIKVLTTQFDMVHEMRLTYMKKFKIEKWSDLDEEEDAAHLLVSTVAKTWIENIRTEEYRLKYEQNESDIILLQLLVGVIDGYYLNFDSIVMDERRTKIRSACVRGFGFITTGPIHDWRWDMYPKLKFWPYS